MSLAMQKTEVQATVNRLLDNLSLTASSQTGRGSIELRQKIGDLRANFIDDIRDGSFAAKLLDCFTTARLANVTLASLERVHQQLFAETPVGNISTSIILMAITFCLAAESRLITEIEFVSRDGVVSMIDTMNIAFDTAKELAADVIDSSTYQAMVMMAGSLINHLATTSRPLPRMVSFKIPKTLPALALSNRIYYVGDRSDELVAENHIIHPAFCPRDIRGLSS